MGRLSRNASKFFKERSATISQQAHYCSGLSLSAPDIRAKTIPPSRRYVNENPRDKLLYDYQMMENLFPDFPKAMLNALVIREQGNMKAVASYLLDKGWGKSGPLINTLSTTENSHFTVKYFWGNLKPSYLEELKTNPVGSYFTAFEMPNRYALYIL